MNVHGLVVFEVDEMAKKSKVEELIDLRKDSEATTPDIEASAVVSGDELMMASTLPQDVGDDRVAAMLSLERTASELARGDLPEGCVKGENGYVILMARRRCSLDSSGEEILIRR
jgi:predicted regulator of Ras-like GTPase activity (Roadblock/LC7/MglB family)